MKKIFDTILFAILTFIFSMILQSLLNYLSSNELEVVLGPKVQMNGKIYQCIDFINNSEERFNDILISVPVSTSIHNIISSNPVKVEYDSSQYLNNNFSVVMFSNIKPLEITKIFIPVNSYTSEVIIYQSKHLKVSNYRDIRNPVVEAITNSILLSILYAIIVGIFTYVTFSKIEKQTNELSKYREEVKNDFDKVRTEKAELWADAEEKLKQVKIINARIKSLQSLKIRDYQKELSFWRNLIKRIVINHFDKTPKESQKFVEMITEEMNTYSTRSKNIDDSDVTELFAKWLDD